MQLTNEKKLNKKLLHKKSTNIFLLNLQIFSCENNMFLWAIFLIKLGKRPKFNKFEMK